MSDSESRIHLMGNGLSPRQQQKTAAQNVTVGEVNDALERQATELQAMFGFYMRQVPTLMQQMMAGMLADFATHNGLTFPGQPDVPRETEQGPTDSVPPVGRKTFPE